MNVKAGVEPAVMAAVVRSTLNGEHTAAGFVMITVGIPGCTGISTLEDASEIHPAALVTVKVYVPTGKPVMVLLVPVPVLNIPSGLRVNVHVPEAGNPLKTTLPVARKQDGIVMLPTVGGVGVAGCTGITTFADGADKHPSELVTA